MEDFSETSCNSILILVFFLLIITIIVNVHFTRPKSGCNCEVCKAYINSTWSSKFENMADWYTHLLKTSKTQTIHIHVLDNTITSNPENVEYMLKTHFDNFPKGKPFSVILGDLLGRGIFNVDGEQWKFQRKMASLELNRSLIYSFDVVRFEIRDRLIPLLTLSSEMQGSVLDLQDVFRRFSFDSMCRFSFGLDPKCLGKSLPVSEFASAFDLASVISAERAMHAWPVVWKVKRMLNIGRERELKIALKKINVLAKEVINRRRKMGFAENKDLLSRFMGSTNDTKYLRDIIISFLLAGRDTIASALTSLFLMLAKHPKVEEAIRNEANRILGPNNELISFKQMHELHYLHATVYESLRLYPPIQFDSKFCLEDDKLADGTFVKKGTRVTYHPYAMGRMEGIWGPDCLEFKPERWLKDGIVIQENNPYKYPVFQAGVRVCLGKEIALVELKSITVSLLQRFDVRLADPGQIPRFSPGLTATFRGGLPVLVHKRKIISHVTEQCQFFSRG